MTRIVNCLPAGRTSLVPAGYKVISDHNTGIDLAKLDFSYCPLQRRGEFCLSTRALLSRAAEQEAVGCLGFAKVAFDAQEEGKDIIPRELRLENYILLTETVLRRFGFRYMGYMDSTPGGKWYLRSRQIGGLNYEFYSKARLPRLQK